MICDVCRDDVPEDEIHEHLGKNLCDDCYMDAMDKPVGCDPWANYLAVRHQDTSFTPVQETILKLVEDARRVSAEELMEAADLDEKGLHKEVITLRHMQKVVWERQPDASLKLKAYDA